MPPMLQRCLLHLLAVTFLACGEADTEPVVPEPSSPCPPGEREVAGACLPAGVQDDGCPAGTLMSTDGECLAAGIPAAMCADGFTPTDDGACEAVLPSGPCTAGLVALPGETLCHELVSCGSGTWGDIPVEANTHFVDQAYAGGDSDGTAQKPWTTVLDGVVNAEPGATIAIAAGAYQEDISLQGKPLRLWGRCPGMVELAGTGVESAAIFIRSGASGTEVRSVAVTGEADGVLISGSLDLRLQHVWIHDTAGRGIGIETGLGPTSVAIVESLIEGTREMGLFVAGAEVLFERSVARGTRPVGGEFGRGLNARVHPVNGDRGRLTVTGSVVEANTDTGVFVAGADAVIEGSVVRDTQARPLDLAWGRGVSAQAEGPEAVRAGLTLRSSVLADNRELGLYVGGSDAHVEGVLVRDTLPVAADATGGVGMFAAMHAASGQRSNVTVRSSVFARNHNVGLEVERSDATIEAVIVRDTEPRQSDLEEGRGMLLRHEPGLDGRTTAVVRGSLIERNYDHGLLIGGSDVTVEGVVVRDTFGRASTGDHGRGIAIQDSDLGAHSLVEIRSSVVERAHDVGVLVFGSDATIDSTLVNETLNEQSTARFGRGLVIQYDPASGELATGVVRSSVVLRSHESGLFVAGATATVENTAVRETLARDIDALWGDGVIVATDGGSASLSVVGSLVEDSTRAGFASFGAPVELAAAHLECNALDLVGETHLGREATFVDQGGNRCGCQGSSTTCTAVSAGLEPPVPSE